MTRGAARAGGRVWLVGFMGAGKTTVGRLLAKLLRARFVDLDLEIARASGMSAGAVLRAEGLARFRARERSAAARAGALRGAVIATGAGAVEDDRLRARLRRERVVWLAAPPHVLARRVARSPRSRPLWTRPFPRALFAARTKLYRACATARIATARRRPQAVAAEIARAMARGSP